MPGLLLLYFLSQRPFSTTKNILEKPAYLIDQTLLQLTLKGLVKNGWQQGVEFLFNLVL